MSPQIIIALVIAALGFTGGWTIQSWRYGAKEAKRVEQILADQRTSAATALRRVDNVVQAQNDAVAREIDLRRSAASARTALISLSDATASALRDAAASQTACLERAATLSEVLGAMAEAGGEVAAKADRHASDVKTLVDGWPK